MPQTTVKLRHDVARRLEESRGPGESRSDVVARLLDNQPATTVEEWMESLAPLEGRGLFTKEGRERLKADQLSPRHSRARL
jgi:predicted CopG family antitoxin